MENFIAHLKEVIPEKDSLKLVKKEAENYYKQHSLDECFATGLELYQSENFQIQEVGVFLVGYAACKNTSALSFLKDTVSQHKSWKVQEILAMAFDNYCKIIGYETAIPVIKEWLKSDCANTRRAVSEGLRIWTSRPYFKEHPQMAIQFLSSLKDDESEYVRKSIGNALKDISKKYPELVSNELKQWYLSSKEIKQVYYCCGTFSIRSSILQCRTRAKRSKVSPCALLMSFWRCSYCWMVRTGISACRASSDWLISASVRRLFRFVSGFAARYSSFILSANWRTSISW